ncbi:MAG: hypothetical protein KY475_07575 [Planctomycetes bacterium]|nr:hypothetical protein [Planctomycetota bacterium]
MDARLLRPLVAICAVLSLGASHRTQHFMVTAATPQLAQEIGQYAERYRRELAVEWLGEELPPWSEPCPIQAQVAPNLGAGGATSFMFRGKQPFGWRMTIQGSRERILDSVLPHEITHTIFATHFGRPLPRWADEGACTVVEHAAERQKQEQLLIRFLTSNKGIAFNKMFAMMEYPSDMLPLYSQGYALAQFFIAQGGKRKFVKYVGEGMQTNNWTATTRKYYGYTSLSDLQVTWVEWIRNGRQVPIPAAFAKAPEMQLASATREQIAAAGEQQATPASFAAEVNDEPAPVSAEEPAPLTAVAADDEAESEPDRYAPGSTARVGLVERSATRPQPVGHPQQRVLEWERSTTLDARVESATLLR